MEEISHRVSRSNRAQEVLRGRKGPARKSRDRNRNSTAVDDDGEDLMECSGQFCRSCTAGVIADCIAICCCPCAVLNCLAFAFVKVPWKIGKKCLGFRKKKLRKRKDRLESDQNEDRPRFVCMVERDRGGNLINRVPVRIEEGMEEFIEGVMVKGSARFEAEKEVWLDLYEMGHLGFGRVSFTGNA